MKRAKTKGPEDKDLEKLAKLREARSRWYTRLKRASREYFKYCELFKAQLRRMTRSQEEGEG